MRPPLRRQRRRGRTKRVLSPPAWRGAPTRERHTVARDHGSIRRRPTHDRGHPRPPSPDVRGSTALTFNDFFSEKCTCCVLQVTKTGNNFTPSAFSPPTPHRHFSSKMAVRLPTPKVDLSKSILNSTEIPGLGDILITHPDVTTDFDWPEMVP